MPLTIDYQVIVNIIAQCITVAMPIGLLFALTDWLVTFFFSVATGKKKVSL